MARVGAARRYAQAVFMIARERNELDAWREHLQAMGEVFDDPETAALLGSRNIPFSEKQRILAALLPQVGPLAMNLARLLVAKGRVEEASAIAQEYQRMADASEGIERAEAVTPVPLTAPEEQELLRYLEQMVGKRIVLSVRVDPAIVGGLVIHVGGRVLDGSVQTKLQELKKDLQEAKV